MKIQKLIQRVADGYSKGQSASALFKMDLGERGGYFAEKRDFYIHTLSLVKVSETNKSVSRAVALPIKG